MKEKISFDKIIEGLEELDYDATEYESEVLYQAIAAIRVLDFISKRLSIKTECFGQSDYRKVIAMKDIPEKSYLSVVNSDFEKVNEYLMLSQKESLKQV